MSHVDILLYLIDQFRQKVEAVRGDALSFPLKKTIKCLQKALEQFTRLPRSTSVQSSRGTSGKDWRPIRLP